MVSKKVTVRNATGLHLRPAGLFCDAAMRHESHITFRYRGGEANAKSVLSTLGACIRCGDEIEIICDGADEDEALQDVCSLVESGFGESTLMKSSPSGCEPAKNSSSADESE